MRHTFLTLGGLLVAATLMAQTPEGSVDKFRKPDAQIEALVMAPPVPVSYFSADYSHAVIASRSCRYVPISELAESEVRIGGLRIDPRNFSLTRENYFEKLELLDSDAGTTVEVEGIPEGAKMKHVQWAPDGKSFCFTNMTSKGVDLYLVTLESLKARKINGHRVNTILLSTPCIWLNSTDILYLAVPDDRKAAPAQALATSSVVQETTGEKKTGVRTYQDLLDGPFDEALYDYCCTVIPAVYTPQGTSLVGGEAVYRSIDPSPDGEYLMAVTEHHPYSYMETHRSWPSKQFIMDLDGNVVRMLKDGTVKEEKAEKGEKKDPKPSGFAWRSDLPATLVWTVSDGGSGAPGGPMGPPPPGDEPKDEEKDKPEKTFTDRMYQCGAPFDFEAGGQLVLAPEYKIGRVTWCDSSLAIFEESSSKQKFRRTVAFVPCDTLASRTALFEVSSEVDSLGTAPVYGTPYTVKNAFGKSVLWTDSKHSYIYLKGTDLRDAEGFKHSFLDKMLLKNGRISAVWREGDTMKESLTGIRDFSRLRLVVSRENWDVVPNYYELDTRKGTSRQLSHIENPVPQLGDLMTKQTVSYTRKDGLKCYASLYLPAGYDPAKDGRLPVFLWTYPYEYKCFAECEKDRLDRFKFTKPGYGNAMIWATQGYAVLDGFTMAIVSENTKAQPNDRFIEQLVMSAEAAIDCVVDSLGVGDRERLAVGGHSYGGYMTANLLAHTRLFRAGIARSGAYNRSLTPFAFQSERRTYWKAKDVYDAMSPFNYADKIKDALMLIHGIQDDNTGTFPEQSRRLYQALVYFGGTARYVQLPYEAHSYWGQETVLDMLYETGSWLDRFVKNAEPRQKEEEKPSEK